MSDNPIVAAIVAARKITLSHRAAFGDQSKIPAIYLSNQNAFKQREKNLLHHFKVAHGYEIELHFFPQEKIHSKHYDAKHPPIIYAYVKNNSGHKDGEASIIFINDTLNYCHRRFFAVKELMHLITATDENVTLSNEDIEVLLDALLNAKSNGNVAEEAENAAYFGAIEIFLNKEAVNQFLVDNPGIDEQEAAHQLAHKYSLPKKMVSFRLRNKDFFEGLYVDADFDNITI